MEVTPAHTNKSSSSKHKDKKHKDKKHKEKKRVQIVEHLEPASKKRKAEAIVSRPVASAASPVNKKAPIDLNTPEKILEWLTIINIKADIRQLKLLRAQRPLLFAELVKVMTSETTKGLIYAYTVKTPIGRIFWYAVKEDCFKSVHDHLNIIRLSQYDKEDTLKLPAFIQSLSPEQRQAVLAILEMTEESTVKPEQWLFGLIESNVIERRKEKPDYKQCAEPCILHDVVAKQSFWLGSKSGKARLGGIVVSRARAVTEKNIEGEYEALAAKRKEIASFLKKILVSPLSSTATALPKQVVDMEDDSSFSFSEDEKKEPLAPQQKERVDPLALSLADAKASVLESIRKKRKLGHTPVIQANSTSLAKSLEVKKNIEQAIHTHKLLNERMDPQITWFRENCA